MKDTKEAIASSSPLHVLQQMELTHGVNNRRHSRSGRPWWKLSVRYLLEQIKQCPRDCTRHFFNPFNSATTFAVVHHHHVNTSTGCSDNPMCFLLWLLFQSSRHGQTCKAPFFSLLFHIVIAESVSITTHHVWLVEPAFYKTGTHHTSHNKHGSVLVCSFLKHHLRLFWFISLRLNNCFMHFGGKLKVKFKPIVFRKHNLQVSV